VSSAFCGLPRKFARRYHSQFSLSTDGAGTADYANRHLPPNRLVDCAGFHKIADMAGQGSAGNVVAALCSFFIPGLGQLLQGRLLMAIVQFCLAAILWFVLLGWIIHFWSILDAALFKPGK
jgi:TM2 domain-containing membrane protein YozV